MPPTLLPPTTAQHDLRLGGRALLDGIRDEPRGAEIEVGPVAPQNFR